MCKEVSSGHTFHRWFEWPSQLEDALDYVERMCEQTVGHYWFSSALYKNGGERRRDLVKYSTFLHLDMDECPPSDLLIKPTALVQTSPGRFQAFWVMENPVAPNEAELINTKMAYFHREAGADFCHDAGHLLRIPYTPNYKYNTIGDPPIVTIISSERKVYRLSDFDAYPTVPAIHRFQVDLDKLPETEETAEEILQRYATSVADKFFDNYYTLPDDDESPNSRWSGVFFHQMNILLEAGMNREEIYTVVKESAANKFARDGRNNHEVWQDVNRTCMKHIEKMQLIVNPEKEIPDLLSPEEVQQVQGRLTFVERYISWAKGLTDAPPQYHQAGAFTILSALLSGSIFLATSHDRVYPNLWFMILAGTTLTRKTTAMRIPLSLLRDVNPESEMATDGSIEGLLSALADRPGKPSIFHKDEFTGLLEAIAHKDYMAGFAEQLTKLYDGDGVKRLLRKEVIDVKDPRFIIIAAGIKDRTQQLLTEEHVMSGFIPRFVFITGTSNIEDIRVTRPPKEEENHDARELLKNELMDMYLHYVRPTSITKDGKTIGQAPSVFEAVMTTAAWERYNIFEKLMMRTAEESGRDYLMPMNVRLSTSTLKTAILIAASQQRQEGILIDEIDILHAIYYCQRWREYASEVVNGVGKTYDERLIDRIYTYLGNSSGITRAELMKAFQLDLKRADLIFGTMRARNLIYQMDVSGQPRYRRAGVA